VTPIPVIHVGRVAVNVDERARVRLARR